MLWLKMFHIFAIVSWFAGLLYLPRLFVYHASSADAPTKDVFAHMEKRLYWFIMTPAMLLGLAMGVGLLSNGFHGGWLLAKLALVMIVIIFHISCAYYMRQLRNNTCRASARFFRFYNEVPAVLLLAILWLVVLKPF